MREIRTSGLMSGDGKRSYAHAAQATAPVLDSTERSNGNNLVRGAPPDGRHHTAGRHSPERVEQRLRALQVGHIEALGEPVADRGEKVPGLGGPPL